MVAVPAPTVNFAVTFSRLSLTGFGPTQETAYVQAIQRATPGGQLLLLRQEPQLAAASAAHALRHTSGHAWVAGPPCGTHRCAAVMLWLSLAGSPLLLLKADRANPQTSVPLTLLQGV